MMCIIAGGMGELNLSGKSYLDARTRHTDLDVALTGLTEGLSSNLRITARRLRYTSCTITFAGTQTLRITPATEAGISLRTMGTRKLVEVLLYSALEAA